MAENLIKPSKSNEVKNKNRLSPNRLRLTASLPSVFPSEFQPKCKRFLELPKPSFGPQKFLERKSFTLPSLPCQPIVDDSDNEDEDESLEITNSLSNSSNYSEPSGMLLLSPMSSLSNTLSHMQVEKTPVVTEQYNSELSPLDKVSNAEKESPNDMFKSPPTPPRTVGGSIDSSSKVDEDHLALNLSPYKTPTKRCDSPDFGSNRKISSTMIRRSRSISYSHEQVASYMNGERSKALRDITNQCELNGQRKRKLPKPSFGESPPLRRSMSTVTEISESSTNSNLNDCQPPALVVQSAESHFNLSSSSAFLTIDTTSSSSISRDSSNESLDMPHTPRACGLPTINGSHPDLNCISPQTVSDLMEGKYSEEFDTVYIVDCRFDYEYIGGHVRSAKNMTVDDIEKFFIQNPILDRKVCIVFYCEFSSKRGPTGYRTLRKMDREANIYPNLYYPEVYLLEGGYKNFFENCITCCDPPNYVEMRAAGFEDVMKEKVKVMKQKSWKRSRSLTFSNPESFKQQFI